MKCLLFFVSVLFLFSCRNQTPSNKQSQMEEKQLVGGWTESEVTPDVEEALAFAMKQINTTGALNEVTSVKTQIVSGRNYDITFNLANGEEWNVVVYMNLKGDYKLTKKKRLSK